MARHSIAPDALKNCTPNHLPIPILKTANDQEAPATPHRTPITGKTLIAWGFEPGPEFRKLLAKATEMDANGEDEATIKLVLGELLPPRQILPRRPSGRYTLAIHAETPEEEANIAFVRAHMDELMKTPVLEHGAVMPDACPAGTASGTIPVGGAVISRAIHPAFHSADICCSLHATLYRAPDVPTRAIMDAIQCSTRFGLGGRRPDDWVGDGITRVLEETENPFLKGLAHRAKAQLADQGDGNHFAFAGALSVTQGLTDTLARNGQQVLSEALKPDVNETVLALVTHHGSRDLGAQVYKRGLAAATAHCAHVSPDTPAHQAWLDPDSVEGSLYWEALGYVARWTKRNHELIHERTASRLGIEAIAAFGNAHNFVWKREGLFYHGKGATPAWRDAEGHPLLGLIPLNMAAPILITLGRDNADACSFAPHGAGRNMSRTALLKKLGIHGLPPDRYHAAASDIVAAQTEGLDVRFFYGRPDPSESPLAYKSAASVRAQIEHYGLADVIATIEPLGCLMAGDYDKPWQRKRNPAD
ncbi:MAG: RtcB family protein [Pseudomonadota bacterium]